MDLRKQSEETKEKEIKFLKEIACITMGTIVGVLVYVFCLIIHLDIFGWNLGLIFSPLAAGYVETYFANRYLQETTGAVSAFILFIVTVVYGFIIANPTLGYNLITAGSIVVIIQAAMPTAINYFIISIILGIISDLLGIFKKVYNFLYDIYLEIVHKHDREPKIQKREFVSDFQIDKKEEDINNMGVLLLTTSKIPDNFRIKEYKGFYQRNITITANQLIWVESENEGIEDYYISILQQAKNQAIVKLIKSLKKDGCNCVINISPSYNSLGTKGKEQFLYVSVTGTGVILEEINGN